MHPKLSSVEFIFWIIGSIFRLISRALGNIVRALKAKAKNLVKNNPGLFYNPFYMHGLFLAVFCLFRLILWVTQKTDFTSIRGVEGWLSGLKLQFTKLLTSPMKTRLFLQPFST